MSCVCSVSVYGRQRAQGQLTNALPTGEPPSIFQTKGACGDIVILAQPFKSWRDEEREEKNRPGILHTMIPKRQFAILLRCF